MNQGQGKLGLGPLLNFGNDQELIPMRIVNEWRTCMEYRELNNATRKDHYLIPFVDQMLDRLAG